MQVQSQVPKELSEQGASASMAMRAMLFGQQEGFRGAPPARWGLGWVGWGYNLLLCALPQRRTPDASRMAS